jgi:methanol metabolism-related c-type cytochrome
MAGLAKPRRGPASPAEQAREFIVQSVLRAAVAVAAVFTVSVGAYAITDGSGDPAAVKSDDGKWADKNDTPTFKVQPDGTVDWYTYVGFTRYSSECLRCHGPDGMGSTYAPALMDSMKRLSYTDFYAVVAGGKNDVSSAQQLVMPANGENKNVMCFIDSIYVYLRARADDAIGRGRPEKHAPKPEGFAKAEDECMG